MQMAGRARDIVTPRSGGSPIVCAEDRFDALLKPDRMIEAIDAHPVRPALSRLIGERGGGGLRQVLEQVVPEERCNATPLYLILDDISGASLVAGWAWSQWSPDWLTAATSLFKDFDMAKAFKSREGICTGFSPGSSALNPRTDRTGTPTPDLRNPLDPDGWHAWPVQDGVNLRRARRIDVQLRSGTIAIDSAFQDSASTPAGGRTVVHEYSMSATADARSLQLLSIAAEPRVLPFVECPGAAANLGRLLGTPLPQLREKVLVELRGTAGCTHLNDAVRALAEVPALAELLRQQDP
jgi:hypothetical protein